MLKTLLKLTLMAIAVPALLGIYFGALQLTGNFHEVIPGELYRSSQPTGEALAHYIKAHGIRTVINLRGENRDSDWYVSEMSVSQKLGVDHIDFPMSALHVLKPQRTAELIRIMRDAPKPILIHCRSGADRTGLAAAIYLDRIAGQDEERAEGQLSMLYGHISIPFLSRTYAMDETWKALQADWRGEATALLPAPGLMPVTATPDAMAERLIAAQ